MRQEFGKGYGPSGLLVCKYSDILANATIENSRSRNEAELPSSPEEIKQAIIEIAKLAIKGPENESTRELLKMIYISLSRFLPEREASLVTERNLWWLSGDPNHSGLRRSKEAAQLDAEIDAEEDRLAQEFDEIILELLRYLRY